MAQNESAKCAEHDGYFGVTFSNGAKKNAGHAVWNREVVSTPSSTQ